MLHLKQEIKEMALGDDPVRFGTLEHVLCKPEPEAPPEATPVSEVQPNNLAPLLRL